MDTLIRTIKKKLIPHLRTGKRRFTGQGMVEFALVLPILLLVTYGLLETGRLLFIYGSTVTAARQAARYGSAIGNNPNNNIPYYRDCDGIDNAANRVGFINTFNDINVTYDRGPATVGNPNGVPISGFDPNPSADTCPSMNDTTLQNGDRIKVQVVTQWQPIVRIVPSWQGFTITSSAERTILTEVAIGVTPSGGNWGGPSGTLALAVTSSTTSFDEVNDTITYTYTITNTSALTLLGPFTVSDNRATTNCSGASASLASGASTTCTGTALAVQTDLDAGFLTNTAVASGGNSTSNQTGVTVPAVQNKALTMLEITPSPDVATVPGVVITYTYKFKNSGNVTLTSPYTISDNKVSSGNITCSGASNSLAPGNITQCQGSYVITAADVTNGVAVNTAAVKAKFSGVDTPFSNYASAEVYTSPIVLTIIPPNITKADVVTYKYNLRNISTVTYHAAYSVIDNRVSGITCPSNSIDPGDTIQCTGTYTITQAMMDAGVPLTNQASATANNGAISSNVANATAVITQTPLVSMITEPSTTLVTLPLPTSINYTYKIKNEGNVTLSAPFNVTNIGLIGNPTCTVPSGSIAPGVIANCTMTYPLQQGDMDAGSIISTATVKIKFGGTDYYGQAPTTTVITHNAPRLTLSLTSTPTSFSAANQDLSFAFKLRNTGNTPANGPFSVTVSAPAGVTVTCGSTPDPLPLQESINCNANSVYKTTAGNVGAGSVSVQATGNAGALSTTLNTSVPYVFVCNITSSNITFSTNVMQLNITSGALNSSTISIQKIDVYNLNYDHSQQRISSIIFNSPPAIWTGNPGQPNPVSFSTFINDYTLPANISKTLILGFNRDYTKKTATPKERIVVTFSNAACPVIDVTAP